MAKNLKWPNLIMTKFVQKWREPSWRRTGDGISLRQRPRRRRLYCKYSMSTKIIQQNLQACYDIFNDADSTIMNRSFRTFEAAANIIHTRLNAPEGEFRQCRFYSVKENEGFWWLWIIIIVILLICVGKFFWVNPGG